MYRKNLLLALLICLAALGSCKKKDNTADPVCLGTYKFSSPDLAILPYPTKDPLVFKSNEGDSIVFSSRGRESSMKTVWKYPLNPSGYQGDYYSCEENSAGFISPNSDVLTFRLYFSNPFTRPTVLKYISLGLVADNSGTCSFGAIFRFDEGTLFTYIPDTSFHTGGYIKAVDDSLKLGPVYYKNVYELVAPGFTYYCPSFFARVFYTIKEGVVGFTKSTGKTWYLVTDSIHS